MPRKWELRIRRDTEENWATWNPILSAGEPGYAKDVQKIKIGDGTTSWLDLNYLSGDISGSIDDQAIIDIVEAYLDTLPEPTPDDGPSFVLLYQNAKV